MLGVPINLHPVIFNVKTINLSQSLTLNMS
jgi:hypothetical protein